MNRLSDCVKNRRWRGKSGAKAKRQRLWLRIRDRGNQENTNPPTPPTNYQSKLLASNWLHKFPINAKELRLVIATVIPLCCCWLFGSRLSRIMTSGPTSLHVELVRIPSRNQGPLTWDAKRRLSIQLFLKQIQMKPFKMGTHTIAIAFNFQTLLVE